MGKRIRWILVGSRRVESKLTKLSLTIFVYLPTADLKATFQLPILGVKKNPQSPMYTVRTYRVCLISYVSYIDIFGPSCTFTALSYSNSVL